VNVDFDEARAESERRTQRRQCVFRKIVGIAAARDQVRIPRHREHGFHGMVNRQSTAT
jgi:hypothetical protein